MNATLKPQAIFACAMLVISLSESHTAYAQNSGNPRPAAPPPAAVASSGNPSTGLGAVVRDTAGPQYSAGGAWRALFGSNWRDLWTAPIDVPTLDLATYAGGLKPFKEGGNQSRTLHFYGGDGQRYVFRTTMKRIAPRFEPDLGGTAFGDFAKDQLSVLHPASSLVAHRLQTAAGALHAEPVLVLMPDDPKLAEYRKTFAGRLGTIEIKPDEVADGVKTFGGADKIVGSDKLMEYLDESLENRFDSRAWLKARMIDAVIGDFDRGGDNWDWACYDKDGLRTCGPIARDRDWAFMNANGAVMKLVNLMYPQIGSYSRSRNKLGTLTFMTFEFDRSQLVGLPWATWDSLVTKLKSDLSDAAIDDALRAQPPAYAAKSESRFIAEALRVRRDALHATARDYYRMVNEYADVFAAGGNERVEIEREADGSVRVRLMRYKKDGTLATDEGPAIDRVFLPAETKEIRIYLEEGSDTAVVRGTAPTSILVRVIGGAGDDALLDSSRVARGGDLTLFYDPHGDNRIVTGPNTRVNTRDYTLPPPVKDAVDSADKVIMRAVQEERRGRFEDQRFGNIGFAARDTIGAKQTWGSKTSFAPAFNYEYGPGFLVGAGVTKTQFGFRRAPYESRTRARVWYAVMGGGFGVELDGDWRPENSRRATIAEIRATQYEKQRFFGFGNDTPTGIDTVTRIDRSELFATIGQQWELPSGTTFSIGPVVRYAKPDVPAGNLATPTVLGAEPFGAAGGMLTAHHVNADSPLMPHRGFEAELTAAQFADVWDAQGAFGRAEGRLAVYVPLWRPTLAIRIGGTRAWGAFPLHEAAFVGGKSRLRGYDRGRFTGDAAAYSSTELRVPVGRLALITRGDVNIFGTYDAGRVWMDGESPGGWHTAYGAGLSFTTLANTFSASWAKGETSRYYVYWGVPF